MNLIITFYRFLNDAAHMGQRLSAVLVTLVPVAGLSAGTVAASPIHGFSDLSRAYVALAIQGDLRPAKALFERSVGTGSAGDALRKQFDARFIDYADPTERLAPNGDLADDVVRAYRDYWRDNLLRTAGRAQLEARLGVALAEIRSVAAHALPPEPDLARLTTDLLAQTGWHYSVAATPPWRDLFVWKAERRANYLVELTDMTVPVEVIFMDDFVVQGWKDFASLGLAATTGWVEDDRLYCVAWAYDTASENFEVSYLKHEARHLADLQRFPAMETVELEYRAKLTELAFARSDLQRIWNDFSDKAANNPASPHAQANWRVVRAIEAALHADDNDLAMGEMVLLDPARVNRTAARLLRENSMRHAQRSEAAAP